MRRFASVILERAIDKTYDYSIPETLEVFVGSRVEVPLRSGSAPGYILTLKETPSYTPCKPIMRCLHDQELLTKPLFQLAIWMAKYYCTPLGQVFKTLLPAAVRGKGKEKEQLFVKLAITRQKAIDLCSSLRQKNISRAACLETLLKHPKGLFLSQLLEEAAITKSPVDTLKKAGHLSLTPVLVDRSLLEDVEFFKVAPKTLNEQQGQVLDAIKDALGAFSVHLLHGVTGSGKTEVYLQAIESIIQQGQNALVMVPEIALTAQTIERFKSRFDVPLSTLHYRLSQGEKFDAWHRIQKGEARIIIGARSAIFAPIPRLGLIIVDEEHESSYKQADQMPCYNGRDLAVMRGHIESCPVILGSATPSLESIVNAQKGKYILHTLTARADSALMPTVKIVDMKREYEKAKGFTSFSDPLIQGIKERLALGEQTILFLNRRGYHTTLFCTACRTTIKCRSCDFAMTYHRFGNYLACHLCGCQIPPPRLCPSCKGETPLKFGGVGTEQIERAIKSVLPEVRTLRMDGDTTRHKGSHEKLFRAFGTGKADVLIGTQMIAKGLHFPQVTLACILNIDSALHIPDYRASETAFQLLTQVSGRSGRGRTKGEVIIQTAEPDHPLIRLAANNDFNAFCEQEIISREFLQFPPFTTLIKITASATDPKSPEKILLAIRCHLQKNLPPAYIFHPVAPCFREKIKDRHRFQLLIRTPTLAPFPNAYLEAKKNAAAPHEVKLHLDINPVSIM